MKPAVSRSTAYELNGNPGLVNPCFMIYNWDSSDKANVKINGKSVGCEKALHQGIIRDT